MSADTSIRCALGVTSRTLSDFCSDGLNANDMERLRGHVAQCPACQARLDEFAAVAHTLRDHPDLDGHAQLWREVRASIAATPSPAAARGSRSAPSGGRSHPAQLWTAFGSIAAVVALSFGFVALFFSRGGWPPTFRTAAPTPITIHSGSLTWKQVIVPNELPGIVAQLNASATYSAPYAAPSDGNTAYACQADRRYVPSPRVWATHDAGLHWSIITPADLPANTGGCRLWIDANDAKVLAIAFFPTLSPQQPAPPAQWVTYATFDGGATWSIPAGLRQGMLIDTLASAHGRIYAQMTSSAPNSEFHTGLYASSDHMRSWTRIDATLPDTAPNPPQIHDTGNVFEMWASPTSGEVLALTYSGSLWSTVDDGSHWTKIAYPQAVITADPWAPRLVVGGPTTSAQVTICGVFAPLQSPNTDQWFECTTDDGQTWSKRPTTTSSPAHALNLVGVGADGSLYATLEIPSSPAHANGGSPLYRLPPGAQAPGDWQPLGAIPGAQNGSGGFQIAPSANGVVFWVFPGMMTETSGSYSKTYTQPNYYVATYP